LDGENDVKILKEEEEMIREYLGDYPRIKVLEFLIYNKDHAYGIREILIMAGVKHRNLIKILEELMNKDMVYIESKKGKSHLYRIHEFHPFISSLILAMEVVE